MVGPLAERFAVLREGLRTAVFFRATFLRAADFLTSNASRLVVTAGTGRDAMLRAAWDGVRRNFVVLGNSGVVDEFSRDLKPAGEGASTGYLCVGQSCRPPETDPARLAALLKQMAAE